MMGSAERHVTLNHVMPAPDLEHKDNRSTSAVLLDRN